MYASMSSLHIRSTAAPGLRETAAQKEAHETRDQKILGASLACCQLSKRQGLTLYSRASVKAATPRLMTNVAKLDAPMVAEPGVEMNWREAH